MCRESRILSVSYDFWMPDQVRHDERTLDSQVKKRNTKMKIAMFSWETLHSICVGGIAPVVTELAAALERKGHEIHVFTRMGHGQQWYELVEGVRYHRCPHRVSPDFFEEVNDMCRSFVHHFFETENHIGGFDIIHANDWLTTNVIDWIKQCSDKKAIFTFHSTEYGRCGNNFRDGASALVRDYERQGSYVADRITAVSNNLKNEIEWIYNIPEWKTEVIYNGISIHNFDGWIDPGEIKGRYGIGPLDPVVLFVGRMTYQKGPDLLVDTIPFILRNYPHTKFVFIGDGDMRWSIEGRAHALGVFHATRFLGYRSGQELTDMFKASEVVCIPSRNEPFGVVVLEAWSAGKPVVATQNGGPNEFVWHEVNGLKVYDKPESIAWGIGTLFANFERAREIGRNGRKTVETAFSWDSIADQMLEVYNF